MYFSRKLLNCRNINLLLNTNDLKITHIIKRVLSTGKVNRSKEFFRLSMIGISTGVVVGTGYSIHQLNKTTTHILNEETVLPVLKQSPNTSPTRKIRFATDQSGLKLTLYQYQTCPFCCKVRAFLDYHGISYDVVEVDPVLKQSIKWSTYKKVPIVLAKCDGGYQALNDSSMIISALSSHLQDSCNSLKDIVKYYPSIAFVDENGLTKSDIMNKYFLMYNDSEVKTSKEELLEEHKWRKWVDEVLVHVLSPNVYRTIEEALQAFVWFSQTGEWEKHFPSWERYLMIHVGAMAMWLIGKRLKTRYHLEDDVRVSLYNECDNWVRAVQAKGTPFLGGNEPNLADLSMYGVLNSIEGCYAFQDLLVNSKIQKWYFDMKEAIEKKRTINMYRLM